MTQLVDACGWTLLHSVWQIAAIALLLAIALRMMSIERCNVRYLSACVALMLMIVAVAGTFAWQMNAAPTPVMAQRAVDDVDVPLPRVIVPRNVSAEEPGNVSAIETVRHPSGKRLATPVEPIAWRAAIESWLAPWIAPIVALWVVGVSLLSLRLCANWLAVRRLRASGLAIDDPAWTRALTQLRQRLSIGRPVALLQSSAAAAPMVIGWLKPVVLVPMELVSGLTSAEIEAILAHELAHIRRHDYLVNLLQNIAETLLFYHPAVWWVSRQIRQEREFCCDDIAAQLCEGTAEYARALAAVETMRGVSPALSVAASGGSLLDRIRRLAGREPKQATGASGVMAGALVVSCVVALLISLVGRNADAKETGKISDEEATAIARKAHQLAGKIDKLPQFYYEAKFRNGNVTTMQEIDAVTLENLKQALIGDVNEETWVNLEHIVAWQPTQMFHSYRRYAKLNNEEQTKSRAEYFGTQTDGWAREHWDPTRPPQFIRRSSIADLWNTNSLLGLDYFNVTPREFWWGINFHRNQGHSPVPPTMVSYRHLGTEQLGSELCDVVESKGRSEKLWIGRESGLIQASMEYHYQGRIPQLHELPTLKKVVERVAGKAFASNEEYQQWYNERYEQLSREQQAELTKAWNEAYFDLESPDFFRRTGNLVVYSDFREIAPNVMFPFREDRALWHHNEEKFKYIRSETRVEKIALNIDLAERIQKLAPKKGDKVQDQRFAATIEYDYDPSLTDKELSLLVEAKQEKLAEEKRLARELTERLDKMVGQPAPALPAGKWIGTQPELTGRPYLVHFWSTSSDRSRNDLRTLKYVVAKKHQIIGIHPPGTEESEIANFVDSEALEYPILVAQQLDDDSIAGYPVKGFPYCFVVDADGKVAAHGSLGATLLAKFREVQDRADGVPPAGFRHMTVHTVDEAGKPVPNTRVYVSIWPDEDNKYKTSKKNYYTDEEGNVEVLVPNPPRLFRVWTQKDGYVPLFANWQGWPEQQPDIDQIPDEFTFTLPTGTKIGGTIVDDAGKPIKGATVEVSLVMNPGEEMRNRPVASRWLAEGTNPGDNALTTDAQGRWSLNNVPAGEDVQVRVKLTHPEYISDTNWGSLQGEQQVTMESLRDETATIAMHSGPRAKGTVTNADGKPVADAVVIWGDDPYLQTGSQEVRTNAEGVYELPPLTPGVYPLTVVAEGWRPELSIVEIEDEMPAADFELKKGNVLRIKFVDENGQPIPEVNVFIREWRGKESLYNHRHPNVLDTKIPIKANKDGIYEWSWAPPDGVTYSLGKKGYEANESILIADGEEYVVELTRENR